jgi:hypothetical protein
VWAAPTTSDRDRKGLLRSLLEEVVIAIDRAKFRADLTLRWRGGAITELEVDLPRSNPPTVRTDEDTVALVSLPAAAVALAAVGPRLTGVALDSWTAAPDDIRLAVQLMQLPDPGPEVPKGCLAVGQGHHDAAPLGQNIRSTRCGALVVKIPVPIYCCVRDALALQQAFVDIEAEMNSGVQS